MFAFSTLMGKNSEATFLFLLLSSFTFKDRILCATKRDRFTMSLNEIQYIYTQVFHRFQCMRVCVLCSIYSIE